MSAYQQLAKQILEEHRKVLLDVNDAEVEKLLEAITEARNKCVMVWGIGRMQCAARAFVMRLMHMGFNAHIVYDTTCPNLSAGDLLIVNAACTIIDYTIMQFARKIGAKIVAITANPDSKAAKLCDFTVNLKGQTHGGRDYEITSIQPMASLFEQTIFTFEDIIIQLLMKKMEIRPEQMAKKHINVDGYMDFNIDEELK
jgi:6-phospho-3-hexuloisomerase